MDEQEALRRVFREQPEFARELGKMIDSGTLKSGAPPKDRDVVIVAADTPAEVTGSKQVRCGFCNSPVWIAPSTQKMIAEREGGVRFTCLKCLLANLPE